ncbi:dodecin family protein [Streptomyces sp. URMC 124]|uniref:dodecin family protein n=1 Tax=Streptomyces sp. URMC 124 TaxID=3423405 RepID=UPI003F1D94FC
MRRCTQLSLSTPARPRLHCLGLAAEQVDQVTGVAHRPIIPYAVWIPVSGHLSWFEVTQIRGHLVDGAIGHYQVGLKVGFRLEDGD